MRDVRLEGVRRFDDRVDDYAKYRPDYPSQIVTHLRGSAGLRAGARVADVGCGTGKLAAVFVAAGDDVVGVEPNGAMREAAHGALSHTSRFTVVAGSAESLPLRDASVDLVTAGQAFHWFEPERARREFARALRQEGLVALVWNNRKDVAHGFLHDYEDMLQRLCPEYARIGNKHYEESDLERFFGGVPYHVRFDHAQRLDRAGLRGRLLSSSYVPASGPARDEVLVEADALFVRHARDGHVEITYDTELFYSTLR